MEPVDSQTAAGPSLATRTFRVVFSPGRLMAQLKEEPLWIGAMVLGALLVFGSTAVIPAEVWAETFRQQMMEAGQPMPEGVDMGTLQRYAAPVLGVVFWAFFAFLIASVVNVTFAFILGDDGTFKQYLAVTVHALLIPAIGGVLTLPLKIIQRDPQLTLNVGLFMPFLERGYWLNFFGVLDMFALWSYLIIGLGVHVIDPRRGWVSASMVLLVFTTGLTALVALAIPR